MGWGGVSTRAGLVDGRVDQRRVGAWLAVPKRGKSREGSTSFGESKGFGSGRVGVLFFESWRVDLVTCSRRFASCCLGVREGLAWRGKGSGWGGVRTGAGLVDVGGRSRALVAGEGWEGA